MDINKTLRKGYNRSMERDSQVEMEFKNSKGEPVIRGYRCYFFLKRELDMEPIRHMKIVHNGYFDYIAKKHFDTIEEWVADCGGQLDDVLYGRNDAYDPFYCSLDDLLEHVGIVPQTDFVPTSSLEKRVEAIEGLLRGMKKVFNDNLLRG
jgi:hypothetical protein